MADEPFNEHFTEWSPRNPDYLTRVRDVQTLDQVLGELFGAWRGIKVLTYQLDGEQLRHLVLRGDLRIIFISRRNLLQVAVSDRIAKQTGVFNRWDVPSRARLEHRYDSLTPLIATPEVEYYLSPQTAKLGTHRTYGQLPNAAQINAALGADDTGWLFPLHPE